MDIKTIQKMDSGRAIGVVPAKRVAFGLLGVVAAAFIMISLHRYLSFDATRSLVELPPPIFPLLVGHVVFGSIAMAMACVQLWPRLRTEFPSYHRGAGRIYVFAGVLPAGLLAIPVALHSPFGPVARASNAIFACVWLITTLTGWQAGRRGHSSAHRRWMIRSGVLTFSILTNRVWGPLAYLALDPMRATTFGNDEKFFAWTIAGLSTWLGWTLPLLVCEGMLARELDDKERARGLDDDGDRRWDAGRVQPT